MIRHEPAGIVLVAMVVSVPPVSEIAIGQKATTVAVLVAVSVAPASMYGQVENSESQSR